MFGNEHPEQQQQDEFHRHEHQHCFSTPVNRLASGAAPRQADRLSHRWARGHTPAGSSCLPVQQWPQSRQGARVQIKPIDMTNTSAQRKEGAVALGPGGSGSAPCWGRPQGLGKQAAKASQL